MTIILNFLWENFVNSQNYCIFAPAKAQMAESVDALVSNTSGAIRAGSTPALGTTSPLHNVYAGDFFLGVFLFPTV